MFMKIPNTFSIFPVKDKKPLVPWAEYQDRFPTLEERERFLKGQVGIVTGPISKIIVLDDDGGLDTKKYPIPNTLTQDTPRGGKHYVFKWIEELETKITTKTDIFNHKENEKGVDIRGAGGFVVFYGWKKPHFLVPLAHPPKWLLDLLPDRSDKNSTIAPTAYGDMEKSKLQETLDDIRPGNRNDSFTRLAGSLRARGYNTIDMFNLLVPKAREVGFGEDELRLVCNSVGRYEPKFKPEDQDDSLTSFLMDAKEIPYIIPGFLAENTINIIAGLGESRKSWILLDLAVAIASGGLWLNRHECKAKKVLVIDQERAKSEMQRRIKALVAGKELKVNDLEGRLIPKAGTTMRINLDQSYDKLCRMLDILKPDVLLIDSLKTFQTGIITDNQSMQQVFERFKELRFKYGLTIVILHHENKMGYTRTREHLEVTAETIAGAASIIEVPESIFIAVSQDSESSMLHHVKNNIGIKQPPSLVKVVDLDNTKTKIKVEAF